jgi:hypothetical protein
MEKGKVIEVFRRWAGEDGLMTPEQVVKLPPDELAEMRAEEFIRIYGSLQ